MISKETIDAIFSAMRIEEIVGQYVQLKKSGSNFKGLSPFTNEKTPSFVVSPAKQIWKDFSSNKGGNVVSFLMEYEKISYPEALRYLAKRYNIPIEEKQATAHEIEKASVRESLFMLSNLAKDYFVDQLWETDEGQSVGLSYFKQRGFTQQTIQKFGLGYSPQKRNAFTLYATKKGYKTELLEQAGFSIVRDSGEAFDRFRDRIIFPIYSYSGRVVGFGARTLHSDKKIAKYVNTPESDIFHKGQLLYGLFQAKQSIIKEDCCILVEGYTDVLALHQAGITHTVASSGTALTEDQILAIRRLTQHILLIFDGDDAGISASFRGIDMILAQGLQVRVLRLPEGEDPDSFAKSRSPEAVLSYIKTQTQDFIHFKIEVLSKDAQSDPMKRADMVNQLLESIHQIPNIIQQDIYIQESAQLLKMDEQLLARQLALIDLKHHQSQKKKRVEQPIISRVYTEIDASPIRSSLLLAERALMRILLFHGDYLLDQTSKRYLVQELIAHFQVDELVLVDSIHQKIYKHIYQGLEHSKIYTWQNYFVQSPEFMGDIPYLAELCAEEEQLHDWLRKGIFITPIEKKIKQHFKDTLLSYKDRYLREQIAQHSQKLSDANISEQQQLEYLEKIQDLLKIVHHIAKDLGRVV